MKTGRMDELEMHPTVKPVALVADALLDVTKRGDLVLDPFGGSGTTLIVPSLVWAPVSSKMRLIVCRSIVFVAVPLTVWTFAAVWASI